MSTSRRVAVERLDLDGERRADRDRVVIEAPLQLRARGTPVATIMRTPGHDLELVAGLLHAESLPPSLCVQADEDAVDIDLPAASFTGRGLLATAACGVCGRAAIADLELRAKEIGADTRVAHAVIAELPERLRAAQAVFEDTGGLHAAGLFTTAGALVCAREDVGRHNAVDKVVGWTRGERIEPAAHLLVLSGRAGYELVQKAIMLGVPVVASVSAPSSLAIELAERFNVSLVGFVRGRTANVYAHAWRIGGAPAPAAPRSPDR
ncbi:MAG: formate dehydrogenase accessory sulfurtransferase FdhD [Myxococcales bacterium]|nr:formate dehydrogenase accessory sulfurtransferase FdhD [Myxococcales bacterium]